MHAKEASERFRRAANYLRKEQKRLQKENLRQSERKGIDRPSYCAMSYHLWYTLGLEHAVNWLQLRNEYSECAGEVRRFISKIDDSDEKDLPSDDCPPEANLAFVSRMPFFEEMRAAACLFDAVADRVAEQQKEKRKLKGLSEVVQNGPEARPRTRAKFVFRRMSTNGDYWHVVFEGRELAPVRHLAGMTFLRALLARPGHEIPALTLYQIENPPPPEVVRPHGRELSPEERKQHGTGGAPTRIMDNKTRQAATKRKAELEDELQDPDLDRDGRDEREKQIEALDKALASAHVAAASGGATFPSKHDTQPRQNVAARIDDAIEAIGKQPAGANLRNHLSVAIRKGKAPHYVGGLTWET